LGLTAQISSIAIGPDAQRSADSIRCNDSDSTSPQKSCQATNRSFPPQSRPPAPDRRGFRFYQLFLPPAPLPKLIPASEFSCRNRLHSGTLRFGCRALGRRRRLGPVFLSTSFPPPAAMAAKPPRRSRRAPHRPARPPARPKSDPRADAYAAYLCRHIGRRLRECREAAGSRRASDRTLFLRRSHPV
jgi:hypothetical protein